MRVPWWPAVCAVALSSCGSGAPPAPSPEVPSFSNDGIRLSYTLDLPSGPGPYPAVVLVHGSGPTTRATLQPLAARFTERGFATLRYDKRGVGQSTGFYQGVSAANSDAMIPLLAGDVAAGVRFLRTRPEIDPARIGLAGGSQAGWIVPTAALLVPDVRFMILLSGPTVPVGVEIYYSDLAEGTTVSFDELSEQLRTYDGPLGFDPLPALRSLEIPGLWLLGGQDRSIPTRECAAILRDLAQQGGKPYQTTVFPDADHGLINRSTGQSAPIWEQIDAFLRQL